MLSDWKARRFHTTHQSFSECKSPLDFFETRMCRMTTPWRGQVRQVGFAKTATGFEATSIYASCIAEMHQCMQLPSCMTAKVHVPCVMCGPTLCNLARHMRNLLLKSSQSALDNAQARSKIISLRTEDPPPLTNPKISEIRNLVSRRSTFSQQPHHVYLCPPITSIVTSTLHNSIPGQYWIATAATPNGHGGTRDAPAEQRSDQQPVDRVAGQGHRHGTAVGPGPRPHRCVSRPLAMRW
jgi:hypothetical protein